MIGLTLAAAIAALHVYILWLEMFRWEHPRTRRAFGGISAELASQTRALAANQGLYNGFLAAGIVIGLIRGAAGLDLVVFALACVAVAGVFGAATAARRILYIQTVPALIALAAIAAGI